MTIVCEKCGIRTPKQLRIRYEITDVMEGTPADIGLDDGLYAEGYGVRVSLDDDDATLENTVDTCKILSIECRDCGSDNIKFEADENDL